MLSIPKTTCLLLPLLAALSALPAAAAADSVRGEPAVEETGPQASGLEMREIRPEPSDAVLFNPGMGLYIAGGGRLSYRPESDAWLTGVADIVYFRPGWCDLEEEGPGSGIEEYFEPIFDFWVKEHGKRVAFRVMSESTHSRAKYVTPEWVFRRGVPGVSHRGLYTDEQIDPVFWDDRYLDLHVEFIERLGRYLDGREGLEYVDIGSIGEWGEMHLGLHMPGRWTPEQLAETGFTRDRYVAAYRRVIDAFQEAFPRTRVFLNVGNHPEINDYAALRGCHFRQDGLTPRGPSHNVGKVYYHPYSRRGVICNYEFHSSYRSMLEKGWDLRETVEQGLSDPISYLNTNILSPWNWEEAPDPVKALFLDAARRVGYRFVLTRVHMPKQFHVDGKSTGRMLVEHTWKNAGVAPCHESHALRFTLHNSSGSIVAHQLHFPRKPTTLWWPGEGTTESTLIRIPPGTPPGDYTLKVAMLLPEGDDRNILLGIQGRDAEDRYRLGMIPGVQGTRRTGVVYREGFEGPERPDWSFSSGIEGEIDRKVSHDDEASLRIEGTQKGSWNYVSHGLRIPILPVSRYRFACWLRVEELEPEDRAPYLKVGLTDRKGDWIENHVTRRYDTGKAGTWQRLEGTFETTAETAGGHLALERGGKDASIRIRAWIDAVELELLEAP